MFIFSMCTKFVDDYIFVQKCRCRDKVALARLVEDFDVRIRARVMRLVPQEVVEDMVQEIFLHILISLDKYKGNSSFSTYVYTVMGNRIADYHRKRFRRNARAATVSIYSVPSPTYDPWVAKTSEILVRQLLSNTSEKNVEVVSLYLQGDGWQEIATKLDISYEAVRSRWRRVVREAQAAHLRESV